NYTSAYQDANFLLVPDTIPEPREVSDYLTFDIQASYMFPYQIKFTAGCLNVTDEIVPLVVGSFADNYDRSLVDLRQRFWYASLSKRF
ncbi:MAG: TonB-dependent receptor, partial [Verrucomicrobiales bacterium]|nr:TonB-dependent receptor [Verrucomicrobiales bacterium]